MVVDIGPPSLWITVNPSDVGDPVTQVLAGVAINLDNFHGNLGPDATSGSNAAAADLWQQPNSATSQLCSQALGHVAAYIRTVEAQGRGTPHFHAVVWLKGAPTTPCVKEPLGMERLSKVT
jgi:hypothetical protein